MLCVCFFSLCIQCVAYIRALTASVRYVCVCGMCTTYHMRYNYVFNMFFPVIVYVFTKRIQHSLALCEYSTYVSVYRVCIYNTHTTYSLHVSNICVRLSRIYLQYVYNIALLCIRIQYALSVCVWTMYPHHPRSMYVSSSCGVYV